MLIQKAYSRLQAGAAGTRGPQSWRLQLLIRVRAPMQSTAAHLACAAWLQLQSSVVISSLQAASGQPGCSPAET